MPSTRTDTPRGVLLKAELNDTAATAFISTAIMEGETAQSTATLLAGVVTLHERIGQNAATFKDQSQPLENARAAQAFKSAFGAAATGFRAEAKAYAEAEARGLEPAPLADSAWEVAFVWRISELTASERVRAVTDLSFAQSSALVRHGDLDRLVPSEVATVVRDRHRITGHLARTGLAADYARHPSLNDPLATGVDRDAALAAATAVAERHRQRGERIRLAADALRSTVAYVAVATGKTPETVFAELTA